MPDALILEELARVIASRSAAHPDDSWTATLLSQGMKCVAQKFGEESIETIIAALSDDSPHLIEESADVLYHLLVLWQAAGVKSEDVWDCLAKRMGSSGLEEKRRRHDTPL